MPESHQAAAGCNAVLLASADSSDDRVEYEVIGWGRADGQRWFIECGSYMNKAHPVQETTLHGERLGPSGPLTQRG